MTARLMASDLRQMPGPEVDVAASAPAKAAPFALHGGHAQRLVFGQLVQDVGGRRDGVGAQKEAQPRFLGGGHQAVGRGLVARDVHVAARLLVPGVDAVSVGHRGVGVGPVVVSGLHHPHVALGQSRLLAELGLQKVVHQPQVAVEEPAHQPQGEHVAALQDGLVVHSTVGQTLAHHRRDGAGDEAIGVESHLLEVVFAVDFGLFQVGLPEAIGVDDDAGLRLGILVLSLQRGGIHGHQHVALVARSIDTALADVYLVARYARERTLRSPDVGRVVGERGDAVAHDSRYG